MSSEKPNIPVILAAVPIELKLLKKQLKFRQRLNTPRPLRLEIYECDEQPVALAITGMGPESVRKAFPEILKHISPNAFLSIGLAGAISPHLDIGDLLIGCEAFNLETLDPIHFGKDALPVSLLQDPATGPAIIEFFRKHQPGRVFSGRLVSASRVISKSEKKKEISASSQLQSPFMGVDMETYALLQEIRAAGLNTLPFVSVRSISDTADDDLDMDFGRFFTREGDLRLKPLLGYVISNPHLGIRFYRLHLACQKATAHLTCGIKAFINKTNRPLWQGSPVMAHSEQKQSIGP